jgi:transcriptional regulator with XRE-family HTH domain
MAQSESPCRAWYCQYLPAAVGPGYPRFIDTKSEIRHFLTSRRAKVKPEHAGITVYGERRVPGLRREEVAVLAGVSADYYTRLERGNLGGASESVLEALAGALQLNEAERAHLFDLARAAQPSARRRRSRKQKVRPSVQWMLDSMTGSAAIAENARLDALATNRLGRALYSQLFDGSGRPVNFARFIFLDPRANEFFADWDRAAKDCVALLRSEAGRAPFDRELSDLVGELSTQSEEFRGHWATHDVRLHTKGEKRFNHPVVGELELSYNRIDLAADPGLMIFAYTAEPGSRSAEALSLLASWAATEEAQESVSGDA